MSHSDGVDSDETDAGEAALSSENVAVGEAAESAVNPAEPVEAAGTRSDSVDEAREPESAKRATDEALMKRLYSLQRPTWELELLISGAVVFSLFQLPGQMRTWFEGVQPHSSPEAGMLPFMAYYFATLIVICLAVAFSLHFVLRSIWVGLTGLRSVFPKGIEWDEIDVGPISRAVFREMNPDLRAAEQRVDRISSTIFAVLFALLVSFFGAFAMLAVPLVVLELARARFFPSVPSMVVFYSVVALVMVPTIPVSLIDNWFKKDPTRLDRHPKLFQRTKTMSRVVQKVFLAHLTTPIILTLSSRFSMKKVTGGLIGAIFMAVGLFIVYFAVTSRTLGFDSYVFFPTASSGALVRAEHYEDQRGANVSSRLPTIQSEVVEETYLRLFVPFRPGRDASRVRHACPELVKRSDGFFLRRTLRPDDDDENPELLRCVSSIYVVRLDGEPVDVDWAFSQHRSNNLKGLVGYVSVVGLDAGRHELFVGRKPDGEETVFTLRDTENQAEPEGAEEDSVVEEHTQISAEAGVNAASEPELEAETTHQTDADDLVLGFRGRYTITFWIPGERATPRLLADDVE